MAKAKQLPSGAYRVQASITIDGQKIVKSFTANTAGEAELAAKEWQVYRKAIEKDSSSMTVNESVDEYISIKHNVLSPSTIVGYRVIQRNYFKDIADIKLNKLSYRIVQNWINKISANYSPKTISHAYGLLSAVIGVFAPKIDLGKITLPQKKKPKSMALSKSETAILINGIQGNKLELPILLALWLGLRRSEIFALEWDDIDFKNHTISINKASVPSESGFITKNPKTTDSERTLKLPSYIENKLKDIPQSQSNKLFDFSPNICTRQFPKICESLKINRYRFHDLRHSMATVGVSLNIADKLVMARGGWNNIATMKYIYQAVLNDDIDTADMLYNEYFNSLLPVNSSHENSHEI